MKGNKTQRSLLHQKRKIPLRRRRKLKRRLKEMRPRKRSQLLPAASQRRKLI
jgi:hypothetical protein